MLTMKIRLFFVTSFCMAALYGQGGGGVQFRDWTVTTPTGKPVVACGELRSLTNFDYSVVSAGMISGSAGVPEHCRIKLFIQPELNIEVNLPTAWNRRVYMFGNGGWAGESFEAEGRAANRARGLKAGFVTAATDTGHSAASEPGASFALNRQKLLDYGFRSLHLTAETTRLIARSYYGAGPDKSYYEGCSQGRVDRGRRDTLRDQREWESPQEHG
jgi:hypothetical protein